MNPKQIAEALKAGIITQDIADVMLNECNMRALVVKTKLDEDAKLEQWKQDLINAPMARKARMAKEKAMDANILSAFEEDSFSRTDMQKLGRRLNFGSRSVGASSKIF